MMSLNIHVYQFVGLLWITEFNAHHANRADESESLSVYATNTILTAHAALEALIQESAYVLYPELYRDRNFRLLGLECKIKSFLAGEGRSSELLPEIISEIVNARHALTHSEPDHQRSRQVGRVMFPKDAARFAVGVRDVALWLWGERQPKHVSSLFAGPNRFIT